MIDLNAAAADDLVALPTVGYAAAYDLILYRPYLTWEEVEYVPGFTPERVDEIRCAGATLGAPPAQQPLVERDRKDLLA
ncbi:hypothetical protein [Phenylobacterium sp.]|jgi:hypothetical protein|uniref:hypothetical protein n=1 Tax=Phenylobacterium sp. TaxID=1871053 RepID=UPI002F94640E